MNNRRNRGRQRSQNNLDTFSKIKNSIDKLAKALEDNNKREEVRDKKAEQEKRKQEAAKRKREANGYDSPAYTLFKKQKDKAEGYQKSGNLLQRIGKYYTRKGETLTGAGKTKKGKVFKALGGTLDKFGKGLKKASFWLVGLQYASQALSQAFTAVAEANKRQQDIQNKRNTIFTNRNIDLSNIQAEGYTDQLNTMFAQQMAGFNIEAVKQQKEMGIASKTALADITAQIGGVIGDINQTAWERLAAQTDIKAESAKYDVDIEQTKQKEERASKLAGYEYQQREKERGFESQKTVMESDAENAKLNNEVLMNSYEHAWSEWGNRAFGGSTEADNVYSANKNNRDQTWNNKYGATEVNDKNQFDTGSNLHSSRKMYSTFGGINDVTSLVGIDFGGVGKSFITKRGTDLEKDITNRTNQLNADTAYQKNFFKVGSEFFSKSNEVQDKILDVSSEMKKTIIDTSAQIEKMYQKMAQTVEDWAMKFQDKAYNAGIANGITDKNKLDMYTVYMGKVTTKLARTYGMTADETMQLQNGYKPGGRAKMLNADDMNKQGALGKIYLGGDFNTVNDIANSTEIFNMGVSETVDLVSEMAKKANKMGLDGRKYLKDMAGYIKQANKYTFKDGVKGVAEMAKWAQNVRFDMNSLPAILDNIQNGGLENVITKAAKTQVLGGRFAMFADPLAMYNESFNDPEALAKRLNNMVQGMGNFDINTGNVSFGQAEQEILKAFADASGQSIEDVRAQAIYNIKKNKVEGVNNDLRKEDKQALVNKAFYEDGRWKVNTIDGKTMDVADVNKENIGMVEGGNYEDTMEKGMAKIVSFVNQFTGAKEGNLSELSTAIILNGDLERNMNERMAKEMQDFYTNFNTYVTKITENMNAATEAYTSSLKQNSQEQFVAKAQEIVSTIQNSSNVIVGKLEAIYQKMGNYYDQNITVNGQKGNNYTVPDSVNDGIAIGENRPMFLNAKNVSSINDGIVKTNPQDSALFAKPNGPFDKLFNGVFGKVNDVWANVNELPKSIENSMPSVVNNNQSSSKQTSGNNISIDPINLNVNGNIKLTGANHEEVNLNELLKNNPMFVRQISQLISIELGKSMNGGRNLTNYPYL